MQVLAIQKKRKARLGGKPEYLVLLKQWIHQGFTYLDKTEMYCRIVWESALFLFTGIWLLRIAGLDIIRAGVVSFFIVHTLNWIFNYNFWTCMTFTFPQIKNPGNAATIRYLEKLQKRMIKYNAVGGCMLYGSISRQKWHNKSDLDMRILRKPGLLNAIAGYLIVFSERVLAVFSMQPLDLYLADSTAFLLKMRTDEFPVFLKNSDERLYHQYKTRSSTDFGKVSDLNNLT